MSRPLFIYVKKAHVGVIPGISEYLAEYTSDRAMGEDGYLADMPLVMDYLRRACKRWRDLGPLLKLLDRLEPEETQVGYTF